jgi:hypothetical protein
MLNEPKVLVVQPPTRSKDLSSAQRYGVIEYIFDDPRFQAGEQPGVAQEKIRKALQDFDPDTDYVLFLGGDPIGAILLGQQLSTVHRGKTIKALRWERERDINGKRLIGVGYYVPTIMKG